MLELDETMDLGQVHPVLDLEFEIEVVGDIVELLEEAGEESHPLLSQTPQVLSGYFHVVLTQQTSGDGQSLRCVGIVVVSVVDFRWIL